MAPKKPPAPAKGKAGKAGPKKKKKQEPQSTGKKEKPIAAKVASSPHEKTCYTLVGLSFVAAVVMVILYLMLDDKHAELNEAVASIRLFANEYDPKIVDLEDIDAINLAQNLSDHLLALTERNERIQRDVDALSAVIHEWVPFERMLYHFSREYKNWAEARDACTARAAALASIHQADEEIFVDKKIAQSGKEFWIGLTKNPTRPLGLEWLSGVPVKQTHWNPGEDQPDKAYELCIFIAGKCKPGKCWHDGGCKERRYYLCKLESNPEWFQ